VPSLLEQCRVAKKSRKRKLRNSWSSESKSKEFDFAESRRKAAKESCGILGAARAKAKKLILPSRDKKQQRRVAEFLEQREQSQTCLSFAES
jgi:hypothetical protein